MVARVSKFQSTLCVPIEIAGPPAEAKIEGSELKDRDLQICLKYLMIETLAGFPRCLRPPNTTRTISGAGLKRKAHNSLHQRYCHCAFRFGEPELVRTDTTFHPSFLSLMGLDEDAACSKLKNAAIPPEWSVEAVQTTRRPAAQPIKWDLRDHCGFWPHSLYIFSFNSECHRGFGSSTPQAGKVQNPRDFLMR